MACRGCLECILKLLNLLLTLTGLAMVGYGIYLFVEFDRAAGDDAALGPVGGSDHGLVQLGRPMLVTVSLSENIFDKLPKAWYCDFSSLLFSLGHIVAQLCLID